MAWCPKCRLEYRDGFQKCNDCEIDLVEESINDADEKESIEYDYEEFLTSVSDNINANIIESQLNDNGIPVLKKHRETGGYLSIYMGMTNLGIDLYVPSKLLGQAKELILSEVVQDEVNKLKNKENKLGDEAFIELDRKYKKKRQIRAWIILLFFIPGLIWLVFVFVIKLIDLFL